MAGHLQTHPLVKTYDELQRSSKRLANYLDMFEQDLTAEQTELIRHIIFLIEKTIKFIPEQHHLTRHEQLKREGRV